MSNTTEQEGAEKEDLSSSKSESDVPTLSSSPGRTYSGQENFCKDYALKRFFRMSSKVADHYNAIPDIGVTERLNSRILYLRNFNNWIKSMLINEFLKTLKQSGCSRPKVLDLCCGKGGDLLKWRNGNISYLVATDIAEVSLRQCERRYNELKEKSDKKRPLFGAEFIRADSTTDRIADYFTDPNIQFDLTSCQFSFHYSFESERQARQMIRNAVEKLRSGGYFIGTLPDANRIMLVLRATLRLTLPEYNDLRWAIWFLNCMEAEVLYFIAFPQPQLTFLFMTHLFISAPLGDLWYLKGKEIEVNCPEYLVHFPVLEKLLDECGMSLVYKKPFPEAFEYFKEDNMGKALLQKMKALETYPPSDGTK
ncbi:unnamed protein product [Enterobius vermicularis]|uniref:mRNA cap guanine-N(7) methyltransferase n=1 Tax=Enterobius vermicularis TaxID=51028 RepID=A0A0N4V0M6_ENTVE|nr:unnamed protein product [Enterobius vermicularis]